MRPKRAVNTFTQEMSTQAYQQSLPLRRLLCGLHGLRSRFLRRRLGWLCSWLLCCFCLLQDLGNSALRRLNDSPAALLLGRIRRR